MTMAALSSWNIHSHVAHRVTGSHLLVLVFQDAAGPAKEAQEHQLSLLQAWVRGYGLQDVGTHLLGIIWTVAKHKFQQQAVILVHLHATQSVKGDTEQAAQPMQKLQVSSCTCKRLDTPQGGCGQAAKALVHRAALTQGLEGA